MRLPDLSTLRGRRVLITGAAGGIGAATARAAARQGAELVLTDRDDDPALTSVARRGTGRRSRAAGRRHRRSTQVRALADAAGPVDVVMNVAGISAWGTVDRLEHRHWQAMVDVNLMGPIHVIESFLPADDRGAARRLAGQRLVRRRARSACPGTRAYSASKFGLRGVSEVLRFDLRRHGIGVSLVCPGGVATPLADTVEIAGVDKTHPAFAKLHKRFLDRAVTPDHVAEAILRGDATAPLPRLHLARTSARCTLLERLAPPLYAATMRGFNDRDDARDPPCPGALVTAAAHRAGQPRATSDCSPGRSAGSPDASREPTRRTCS